MSESIRPEDVRVYSRNPPCTRTVGEMHGLVAERTGDRTELFALQDHCTRDLRLKCVALGCTDVIDVKAIDIEPVSRSQAKVRMVGNAAVLESTIKGVPVPEGDL